MQSYEVGAFIRFRLKVEKAGPDLFTEDMIKLIELDSKGNRRLIMNLAGNCMVLAVIRQEKLITNELARGGATTRLEPPASSFIQFRPLPIMGGVFPRWMESTERKSEQNQL